MPPKKSAKVYRSYQKGPVVQEHDLDEQDEVEKTQNDKNANPAVQNILHLQKTIGNQAVMRLLKEKNTTSAIVQRGIFDKLKGKKKTKTPTPTQNIPISGPTGGRPLGAPLPPRKNPISKYEFITNPQRVALFLNWANQFPGAELLTPEILRVDIALSSMNTKRPSLDEAKAMVEILKGSPDPEIQRIVRESVERFRLTTLADNFVSEEQYTSQYGGLRQLQGISGKLNYYSLDIYSGFTATTNYDAAMVQGALPPPVPSREGRPALSNDNDTGDESESESEDDTASTTTVVPPPVPSREGRPPLSNANDVPGNVPPPVPSRVGRPALSTPPTDEPAPPPIPVRQPITLTDRADPRKTEAKALSALKNDGKVKPELLDQLAGKMAKGQTKQRGRDVTDTTEAEYAEILSKLSPDEVKQLKAAVTDYTQSSTAVNNYARGVQDADNEQRKMQNIDQMFTLFDEKGVSDKSRVTYRLTTYRKGQEIPYGSKINVGDFIMDKAFVSASENRQLLVQGVTNATPGTRYVKFTILGGGGANISGGSLYNNANELQFHNMATPNDSFKTKMKRKYGTANAGQAEILYRRNSVFKVESIKFSGKSIYVVVVASTPEEAEGNLKNSFSGAATTIAADGAAG